MGARSYIPSNLLVQVVVRGTAFHGTTLTTLTQAPHKLNHELTNDLQDNPIYGVIVVWF
jgi:hypothetical protein